MHVRAKPAPNLCLNKNIKLKIIRSYIWTFGAIINNYVYDLNIFKVHNIVISMY